MTVEILGISLKTSTSGIMASLVSVPGAGSWVAVLTVVLLNCPVATAPTADPGIRVKNSRRGYWSGTPTVIMLVHMP